MKLAIVTPFVQRSAIGRVNAAVADQLAARGHEVQIIRSESIDDPDAPLHPTTLPCRHWSKVDLPVLARQVDLAIVNVGDNYLFHGGIFPVLEHLPSLGVFHDFYIYNLFSGWLYDQKLDWKVHDGEIEAVYGPEALDTARAARSGELDMGQIAQVIPMTEWVARRCMGALSHADFYRPRLEAVCPGPVGMIPLCGPARPGGPAPARKCRELVVVTLGVMNANKCAAEVIQAIAASETLKAAVRYRLVGAILESERERLTALAAELGFTGLSIEGAVDDDAFESAMADADIITCLRRPVLEGASGSVIDGMLSGRPTIVCDAGFYGELPDDLVCKIEPQVDPAQLTAALERLAADPAGRRKMGEEARAYALDALGPERYAEGLEAAAQATIDALPLLAVGGRMGWRLSQLGLDRDHPSISDLSSKLALLFAAAR
ncbi:glycosyltransferase family 4 protein [Caulobacter sp. NIBR2454]|uniref:glycosyltransferase family 4 protein n=1 Tax=Caulobacter sp. NIBR2454 TaxID=3015996 RepID=UPI0022B64AA6|nr:glycosyltransferase family 4 protein [Caulobacter sp. NIBR2454]